MSKRSTFAKGALAVAVSAMTLGAAVSAFAQPGVSASAGVSATGPSYSNYDSCERDAQGRGVGGALVGGGLGAVMGSQIAARGHRTDGSVVGGLVGAIAGATIGHNTAACNKGYTSSSSAGYSDAPPPPPPPPAYVDSGYYPTVRHERYRVAEGPPVDRDGCTFADSVVYMPDGGTAHRSVRVCLDRSGRFQIVD